VSTLRREGDAFSADTSSGTIAARRVLIATGIADKRPDFSVSDAAVFDDAVRYCPVCDGFEAIDKRIAVYGPPEQASGKARFLRVYSPSVTLIPSCADAAATRSAPCDFELASSPARKFSATARGITVGLQDGRELTFDVLYPALGCHVHSELATAIGAKTDDVGCLVVDNKQQTTVEGVYAAGDVVSDLHQLVIAEAHGAIAATAIHNSLPFNLR
jgi:thioredoxin reductase (NADPH)